jgi:hypothetical protein
MPNMLDLIRASAVPPNLVQSAAKGSLSIPAPEMVEILVYLATQSDVFAEQAQLTLASWDEKSSLSIAANPVAPKEVLDYLVALKHFRPVLLPALLANPAVSEASLAEIAAIAPREAVAALLKSSRVERSFAILKALHLNPNLSPDQTNQIRSQLSLPSSGSENVSAPAETTEAAPDAAEGEEAFVEEIAVYMTEHATEIAAEEKPFQPIGGMPESLLEHEEAEPKAAAAAAAAAAGGAPSDPVKAAAPKKVIQRGSALQKISTLDVKGRIQLAMKGSKEERAILVRDGTKVVALAVLDSPKITDGEVEKFASQKNVLETLLRGISMKRRFVKNYNIVRNLVGNPRTPTDISLGLMKNLLIGDLKAISGSKDVSENIRKLALKMFKQKKDPSKSL